jgi:hypothetical protein
MHGTSALTPTLGAWIEVGVVLVAVIAEMEMRERENPGERCQEDESRKSATV